MYGVRRVHMREAFGVQSRVSDLLEPRMGYMRHVRVDYGTEAFWSLMFSRCGGCAAFWSLQVCGGHVAY